MAKLKKATRQQVKLRLGIAGPSGSGKTASALLMAYGMVGDWTKIAVIDTENESASLYANNTLTNGSSIGEFQTLPIAPPFSPESYIEAIQECEQAGIEVIIIDSISHEWSGKGGCLDIHEATTQKMKVANSFTAWAQVTPRHQAFIDAILQCKSHVITTVRSKAEYVLQEKNGKQVPQKVGMASVTREGFEYELSVSLELDTDHMATASKDRTGLFEGKPKFIISEQTGKDILNWCMTGEKPDNRLELKHGQFLKVMERVKAGEIDLVEKVSKEFKITSEMAEEFHKVLNAIEDAKRKAEEEEKEAIDG